MLVDSHCHLDMLKLEETSLETFIANATEQGVEHMLCVSVSLERFHPMFDLIKGHDKISASVGVHPDGTGGQEPDADELIELAKHDKIVAIGETGLDYFRIEGDTEWQRERFRNHIRAAKACGKPLIIHTRSAREDTIHIMQEEGAAEAGGVMHCFTEDWDMATASHGYEFLYLLFRYCDFQECAGPERDREKDASRPNVGRNRFALSGAGSKTR